MDRIAALPVIGSRVHYGASERVAQRLLLSCALQLIFVLGEPSIQLRPLLMPRKARLLILATQCPNRTLRLLQLRLSLLKLSGTLGIRRCPLLRLPLPSLRRALSVGNPVLERFGCPARQQRESNMESISHETLYGRRARAGGGGGHSG